MKVAKLLWDPRLSGHILAVCDTSVELISLLDLNCLIMEPARGCTTFNMQNCGNTKCLNGHYNGVTGKWKTCQLFVLRARMINVKTL